MNCRTIAIAASLAAMTGCGTREPVPEAAVIRPNKVMDFDLLYGKNCAGCHGPNGKGGAAIGLGDPVYLAIADDTVIRKVTANGVPGTSMPAFAQQSGGMLTDEQIDVITAGIRARWAKPDALRGAHPPSYLAQSPGDGKRGASVYGIYCASCHGADGRGGRASSIVAPSYLGLVSDQSLRTTVITGRPDLGAPDWRGNVPGQAMSPEDVSDVVAWLAAQRPSGGSQ